METTEQILSLLAGNSVNEIKEKQAIIFKVAKVKKNKPL